MSSLTIEGSKIINLFYLQILKNPLYFIEKYDIRYDLTSKMYNLWQYNVDLTSLKKITHYAQT